MKLEGIRSGDRCLVSVEQQTAWVQEPQPPQTPCCRKSRRGRKGLGARRSTDGASDGRRGKKGLGEQRETVSREMEFLSVFQIN